jgi:hypothetical protein
MPVRAHSHAPLLASEFLMTKSMNAKIIDKKRKPRFPGAFLDQHTSQ